MRIRKRQVHFSSSESISPLHLSDPHLMNRSPVVVQHREGTQAHTPSLPSQQHVSAGLSLDRYQPSDQTLPLIGKLNNGYDYPSGSAVEESAVHKHHNKLLDPLDEKESGENKSNHVSKGDILVVSQVLPSSSTFEQDEIWWEGEKTIPLKKRKGRFENIGVESNDSKKVKAKMNKKCSKGKDDDEEESERKVKVKKRVTKRGSAVMEGSRCSRVNGRGWRCCQQTLVGYSLCEHHLGKGRLRSMTSVRNKSNIGLSTTIAPNNFVDSASSSNSDFEKKIMAGKGNDNKLDNDDEEKKKKPEVIIAKKRVKLGMVKARSMSSLLGQIDNKVVVDHENENENNK